jgi:hypothetical protein
MTPVHPVHSRAVEPDALYLPTIASRAVDADEKYFALMFKPRLNERERMQLNKMIEMKEANCD